MINIKGLNKAKVLAALYNASKPLGLGILQYDPKDMSEKEAINAILKEDVIVIKQTPKFELGRVVTTIGVDTKMKEDSSFKNFVQVSLGRYSQCDWGDTCNEDKQTADESLRDGERILAVYEHKNSNTKIWIITEWDRSVTTILFPDEY